MENEVPLVNQIFVSDAPSDSTIKRTVESSMQRLMDRQQAEVKPFKAPAPVPPMRKARVVKSASAKPRLAPSPVSVPPKTSPLSATERYMSPTDSLVSPVTKVVLARNRRPMRLLNPWGPPKALENSFHGVVQTLKPVPHQR